MGYAAVPRVAFIVYGMQTFFIAIIMIILILLLLIIIMCYLQMVL